MNFLNRCKPRFSKRSKLVISGSTRSNTGPMVSVFTGTFASRSTSEAEARVSFSMSNLEPAEWEIFDQLLGEGMQQLVTLHGQTGVGDTGEYLIARG